MNVGNMDFVKNIIGEITIGDTKGKDLGVQKIQTTLCSSCGYEMVYLPAGLFFCPKCARIRKWVWLL